MRGDSICGRVYGILYVDNFYHKVKLTCRVPIVGEIRIKNKIRLESHVFIVQIILSYLIISIRLFSNEIMILVVVHWNIDNSSIWHHTPYHLNPYLEDTQLS